MATIIKKGTNPSCFKLSNGKIIKLEVGVAGGNYLNIISDADFSQLMEEYGSFIRPRILSDKNPGGCFIISESLSYAKDMNKEVGEIKDASAPIELPKRRGRRKNG